MALFNILEAPNSDPDRVIVVREGFSSAALIFTVFWTLWHRMWIATAVLIALLAGISLAVTLLGLNPILATALEAALGLILGLEAANLRVMSWQRSGYRLAGLVEASNQEAAELKYFMTRKRPLVSARAPVLPPASHDTLGLFGNV